MDTLNSHPAPLGLICDRPLGLGLIWAHFPALLRINLCGALGPDGGRQPSPPSCLRNCEIPPFGLLVCRRTVGTDLWGVVGTLSQDLCGVPSCQAASDVTLASCGREGLNCDSRRHQDGVHAPLEASAGTWVVTIPRLDSEHLAGRTGLEPGALC